MNPPSAGYVTPRRRVNRKQQLQKAQLTELTSITGIHRRW